MSAPAFARPAFGNAPPLSTQRSAAAVDVSQTTEGDFPITFAESRSQSNVSEVLRPATAAAGGGSQRITPSVLPSSQRASPPPQQQVGPDFTSPIPRGQQQFAGAGGHFASGHQFDSALLSDPSLTSPEQLMFLQQQQMLMMQQGMGMGMGMGPFSPSMPNMSAVPMDAYYNQSGANPSSAGMLNATALNHFAAGPIASADPRSPNNGAAPFQHPHQQQQQQQQQRGAAEPASPVASVSAYSPAMSQRGGQQVATTAPHGGGGSNGGGAASHHRLMTLDPRRFTVDDINELLRVIEVSNQYGKEIERSVEELASLLQRKTVECEGLRRLAAENHSSLAEAVKNEYNSRVRVEDKQASEIRDLHKRIATMRSEKDDLQREVETLRLLVEQLKSTPQPLTDAEVHEHSIFNRLAKGTEGPNARREGVGAMLATWDLPRPAQLAPSQRDLINYVGNLPAEAARALQSAGTFDFLTVLCQRLCTPINAKGDVYPEMGVAIGELLKELRLDMASGGVGASHAIPAGATSDAFLASVNGTGARLTVAQQAASATIPLVKKSARMRVIDLFLANNPQDYTKANKVTELNKLLEDNEGDEEALYERLLAEYRAADPSAAFLKRLPNNSYVYQPPQTPENAAVAAPIGPFRPASTFLGGEPSEAGAGTAKDREGELRVRITLMYKKYNPSKLKTREFAELMRKYPPETLLRALVQRYGPEPTPAERRQLINVSQNA